MDSDSVTFDKFLNSLVTGHLAHDSVVSKRNLYAKNVSVKSVYESYNGFTTFQMYFLYSETFDANVQ